MKLNTKEFKKVCTTVLSTVNVNEVLELVTEGNNLFLNVSNKDYYLSAKFGLDKPEELHAIINATKFLKLISSLSDSVESIDLTCTTNYVNIKANNNYKIPLTTLAIDTISINNPTVTMDVDGDILNNILAYNTQELTKYNKVSSKVLPVQTMYYIDQEGCITFTDGACVNNFSLAEPIQLLLNQNLVSLFKLFKGTKVQFTLGYDGLSDTLIQTKVRFETDSIILTAITSCNNTLLNQVPTKAIRNVANKPAVNTIIIDKDMMLQALNRLLLFAEKKVEADLAVGIFKVDPDGITISWNGNEDFVKSETGSNIEGEYTFPELIKDIKDTLETVNEQFVPINYGDHKALVVIHNGGLVRNVIPEVEIKDNGKKDK